MDNVFIVSANFDARGGEVPPAERMMPSDRAWIVGIEKLLSSVSEVFWCGARSAKWSGIRSSMSSSGGRRGNSVRTWRSRGIWARRRGRSM